MDKLQREQLASANKPAVVLVEEIESENSEKIGEKQMCPKVGVGFRYEVEPIFSREVGMIPRFIWRGRIQDSQICSLGEDERGD